MAWCSRKTASRSRAEIAAGSIGAAISEFILSGSSYSSGRLGRLGISARILGRLTGTTTKRTQFGVNRFGFSGLAGVWAEVAEAVEGGEEVALEGIQSPLQARVVADVAIVEGDGAIEVADAFLIPVVGLAAGGAAEEPFAADDDVDEGALFGSGGRKLGVELGCEGLEVGGVFVRVDSISA